MKYRTNSAPPVEEMCEPIFCIVFIGCHLAEWRQSCKMYWKSKNKTYVKRQMQTNTNGHKNALCVLGAPHCICTSPLFLETQLEKFYKFKTNKIDKYKEIQTDKYKYLHRRTSAERLIWADKQISVSIRRFFKVYNFPHLVWSYMHRGGYVWSGVSVMQINTNKNTNTHFCISALFACVAPCIWPGASAAHQNPLPGD